MNDKRATVIALIVLFGTLLGPVQARADVPDKVQPVVGFKAQPFPLAQVRLLDGPFKEAMERDRRYLLFLDVDRLLHNFRVNAGLPSSAKPYGGWEKPDCELRGHTVGHYLSALAFMAAATGDQTLRAKGETIVAELAKCQQALGNRGYLSAFPEEYFDRVESVRRVWAPYYTLHKIMAGLLDWHVLSGSRQALDILTRMAAWVKFRTDRSDEVHMQRVLSHTEQGGMNDVLANLYAVTGNPEHLALARRFDEKAYNDPLARHEDKLTGLHVNSFIPTVIGSVREYELTGDLTYKTIADFFWTQVTSARSFATGGTSNDEIWGDEPYRLAGQLGRNSHETCCTYNMLKLTRGLFGLNPDPRYFDYYERALFNGILSTQDPKKGMVMYYVPMASGLFKTFMDPEDSFWCCTGTGMESHAKYGDSIYFHDEDGVMVNLFIASELTWPDKGIRLRQETRFPEEGRTSLIIDSAKPSEWTLAIRIPGWVERGGQARLNGRPLDVFAGPGSYLKIRRSWRKGDRLDVTLPMGLRLERLPDKPSLAAVMFGPIVLAGELGGEGLTDTKVYGPYGPEGDPVPVPTLAAGGREPGLWIAKDPARPLTFRTVNVGRPKDVTLVPFYKLFGQRYAIYWEIKTE